ncbi:hypothetical protein B0T26DRAFT_835922, partial [Lasiosphaeria miniovina]
MVYYGALSRGCQQCRQRKVKCDQRKPACLRCEKAKTKCPGFRNLGDVMFRDESRRIIAKAKLEYGQSKPPDATINLPVCVPCPSTMPRTITPPIREQAVSFFFAKYVWDGPPFTPGYSGWLADTYRQNTPNCAMRATIEAAGMAGLSNVYYAPHVAAQSRAQYGRALAALKQTLNDPVTSIADTTLNTVLLMGLFEFVTFDSWDRKRAWAAHIDGANALVQLRGQAQFQSERGNQLFSQVCSQISPWNSAKQLYACMQHDLAAPEAIVQIADELKAASEQAKEYQDRPRHMRNICFRFLHLRSAIRSREITDPESIFQAAAQLDRDLEVWRKKQLEPAFSYITIPTAAATVDSDCTDTRSNMVFLGRRHIYVNPWTAQTWSNWRTMRILTNQIIIYHHGDKQQQGQTANAVTAAARLVHHLCDEICVSVSSFENGPRTVCLIWPL